MHLAPLVIAAGLILMYGVARCRFKKQTDPLGNVLLALVVIAFGVAAASVGVTLAVGQ